MERPKLQVGSVFPIIEIFGPTIQGEGYLAGSQSHFVRFGGCDYRCSWCDSLHAVTPDLVRQNAKPFSTESIVSTLWKLGPKIPWVTLSGGNPALFGLENLVCQLNDAGYLVAVETQGTLWKDWMDFCQVVTVSPKPPSSKMKPNKAQLDRYMKSTRTNLKIVVFDEEDFIFSTRIRELYPTKDFFLSVGTKPNDNRDTLCERLRWLSERVLRERGMENVRVYPQLHVLTWGHIQGV